VCRTALRLHLDGEQLATQLLMSSAWSEAAVNVIQQEWNQQVNCMCELVAVLLESRTKDHTDKRPPGQAGFSMEKS